MSKIEKGLFWCGSSLAVALVVIVLTMGITSWINGLVIPFVAIGGTVVGMRLKEAQFKIKKEVQS